MALVAAPKAIEVPVTVEAPLVTFREQLDASHHSGLLESRDWFQQGRAGGLTHFQQQPQQHLAEHPSASSWHASCLSRHSEHQQPFSRSSSTSAIPLHMAPIDVPQVHAAQPSMQWYGLQSGPSDPSERQHLQRYGQQPGDMAAMWQQPQMQPQGRSGNLLAEPMAPCASMGAGAVSSMQPSPFQQPQLGLPSQGSVGSMVDPSLLPTNGMMDLGLLGGGMPGIGLLGGGIQAGASMPSASQQMPQAWAPPALPGLSQQGPWPQLSAPQVGFPPSLPTGGSFGSWPWSSDSVAPTGLQHSMSVPPLQAFGGVPEAGSFLPLLAGSAAAPAPSESPRPSPAGKGMTAEFSEAVEAARKLLGTAQESGPPSGGTLPPSWSQGPRSDARGGVDEASTRLQPSDSTRRRLSMTPSCMESLGFGTSAPSRGSRHSSRPPSPTAPSACTFNRGSRDSRESHEDTSRWGRSGRPIARSSAPAEEWVRGYAAPPLTSLTCTTYPCGVVVDFTELAPALAPLAVANAPHRPSMIKAINEGDHIRRALDVYRRCDRSLNGYLSWDDGGVSDFAITTFREYGLELPAETQVQAAMLLLDPDRRMFLDARECLCMLDALLRATFISEPAPSLTQLCQSLSGSLELSSDPDGSGVGGSSHRGLGKPSHGQEASFRRDEGVGHRGYRPLFTAEFGDADEGRWDVPAEVAPAALGSVQLAPAPRSDLAPQEVGGGVGTQPPSPPRAPGFATAAAAASAAAAAAVAAAAEGKISAAAASGPRHDALAEARAETERLRRELEGLRELEAASVASAAPSREAPHAAVDPPQAQADALQRASAGPAPAPQAAGPVPAAGGAAPLTGFGVAPASLQGGLQAVFEPPPPPAFGRSILPPPPAETAALVWTARAHAENMRLERELRSLRAVAERQSGEVQWLHGVKAGMAAAAREHRQADEYAVQPDGFEGSDRLQQGVPSEPVAGGRDGRHRAEQELPAGWQASQERLAGARSWHEGPPGSSARSEAAQQPARPSRTFEEMSEHERQLEAREHELEELERAEALEQERILERERAVRQRELRIERQREQALLQGCALEEREQELERVRSEARAEEEPELLQQPRPELQEPQAAEPERTGAGAAERQQAAERERALERERAVRLREMRLEAQRERAKQQELALEERERDLEREREREFERLLERERERERERTRELERERARVLEREREVERERARELERERARELERERQLQRERAEEFERECERERERRLQCELELERERLLKRERAAALKGPGVGAWDAERQRRLERERELQLKRELERDREPERETAEEAPPRGLRPVELPQRPAAMAVDMGCGSTRRRGETGVASSEGGGVDRLDVDSPGSHARDAVQQRVAESRDEPEVEDDADAGSAAAAAAAAAAALENKRLRRELEGLRALAHWQQGEVGAAIAYSGMAASAVVARSAASTCSGGRRSLGSAATPAPAPALSAVSDSELSGPQLAQAAAPDAEARQHQSPKQVINLQQHELQAGIAEYDRTVRTLMSRVLGRTGDAWRPPVGEESRRLDAGLEAGGSAGAPFGMRS